MIGIYQFNLDAQKKKKSTGQELAVAVFYFIFGVNRPRMLPKMSLNVAYHPNWGISVFFVTVLPPVFSISFRCRQQECAADIHLFMF